MSPPDPPSGFHRVRDWANTPRGHSHAKVGVSGALGLILGLVPSVLGYAGKHEERTGCQQALVILHDQHDSCVEVQRAQQESYEKLVLAIATHERIAH